jgi:hypothetical protein
MSVIKFSNPLESKIERQSCFEAKKLGWMSEKFSGLYNKSVPDRIFIKNGVVVFIEFKRPRLKPTKLQQLCHSKMIMHGALVFVSHSVFETISVLQHVETKTT